MTTSKRKTSLILALYFEDGRTPIKIYRMTGIPLDTVKIVIYRGKQ
jgi:hypothetical protein